MLCAVEVRNAKPGNYHNFTLTHHSPIRPTVSTPILSFVDVLCTNILKISFLGSLESEQAACRQREGGSCTGEFSPPESSQPVPVDEAVSGLPK